MWPRIKTARGFSLTEMLVSLIIAGILILSLGVISELSSREYLSSQRQIQIYRDLHHCLKFIQNRVRKAQAISTTAAWTRPEGQGKKLICTVNGSSEAFGVLTEENGRKKIVYLPDSDQEDSAEDLVIFSANDILLWEVTPKSRGVEVSLRGQKNNVPFEIASLIQRRIE